MRAIAAGLIAAALLLGLSPTAVHACHKAGDMGRMAFTNATVRVEPGGIVHYEIAAICFTFREATVGLNFTASGTWDPGKRQARERANGEGAWHGRWTDNVTTWSCLVDPWVNGNVSCSLLSVEGPGLGSQPDLRPFSSNQGVDWLRAEVQKATPRAPELPPSGVKAVVHAANQAGISWRPPADQTSQHRTVGWYEVERRVAGAGGAWFAASPRLRETAASHRDPDPLKGNTEYRVCAGNVSGRACSAPVSPQSLLATAKSPVMEVLRQEQAPPRVSSKVQMEAKVQAAAPPGPQAKPSTMMRAAAIGEPLAQSVRDLLARQFPPLAPKIEVAAAADGVVTLTGSVPAALDKTRVGDAVARVAGVTRVDNRLVAGTSPLIPASKIQSGIKSRTSP